MSKSISRGRDGNSNCSMVLADGYCWLKVEEARFFLALWRESKLSIEWEERELVLRLMLPFRFVARE